VEPIRKAIPVKDENVKNTIDCFDFVNQHSKLILPQTFAEKHKTWVESSKNFRVKIEFDHAYVTYGVTDAFNDFYFLHNNISVLKGEYSYHRDLGINVLDDIGYIKPYTALIISFPFSATGKPHKDWKRIIEICEQRHIDVFLDLCLFGVSYDCDLEIPDCVTHCAFSFSKTFASSCFRTGILYTRYKQQTPIANQNAWFYHNQLGAQIHYDLMCKHSPDYIVDKYLKSSLEICKKFNIEPTNTIIFGTSDDDKWNRFNRDITNRMCISELLSA